MTMRGGEKKRGYSQRSGLCQFQLDKLLFCLLIACQLVQLTTQQDVPKDPNGRPIPINYESAFTNKEICIRNVIEGYKNKYIPFNVKKRIKQITKMYRMEKKQRKVLSPQADGGEEDGGQEWQSFADIGGNQAGARLLEMRSVSGQNIQPRKLALKRKLHPHLRKFLDENKEKLKIFGVWFSYKTLRKNPAKVISYMKEHWSRTVLKGQWYNHEASASSKFQRFLVNQFGLFKKYRSELDHCHLNVKPSLERCEGMYGKNNCLMLYAGVVHKKCPQGLERVGCCSCATPCPSDFYRDDFYYCIRSKFYRLDQYHTEKECVNEQHSCRKYKNKFIGHCAAGFEQEDKIPVCRTLCPGGWTQIERSLECLKPTIVSLGTPFIWIKSDN